MHQIMKFLSRFTVAMFVVSLIAGCDLPRTSQQICDCRFFGGERGGEYSRLEHAPSHFNEDEYWDDLLAATQDPEFANAFSNKTTHWYRNEKGEALACVVFEGSDQINAYIALSPVESLSEPTDMRIIGPEHSPPRLFWERC